MALLAIDDTELIRLTTTHPGVWKWVSESTSIPNDPLPVEGLIEYWGCFGEDDSYYGYFRIDSITSMLKEIHTCLLPNARGEKSKKFRNELEDLLGEINGNFTLITKIPSNNRLALKFALDGGMAEVGVIRNGWNSRDGLVDLILLQKEIRRQ